MTGLTQLPDNLPVPDDDGACNHLVARQLPAIALGATAGNQIDLSRLAGLLVIYCYPMTGRPDQPLPEGWDSLPGARGCTPQACAFRDHYQEITRSGARIYGLSTQTSAYQLETKQRLRLPFELLSDHNLMFTRALDLPTFEIAGMTLIKRLTLIACNGCIEKVFYPVFPPDKNASAVMHWLQTHKNNLP